MSQASDGILTATGRPFLTDGGIETSLIHDDGFDLPHFAAFPLVSSSVGRTGLVRYYERYLPIAQTSRMGFVLESPTWRANPDWGQRLGYSSAELAKTNEAAIHLLRGFRDRHASAETPIVISGCVGPRGDGYVERRYPWSSSCHCRQACGSRTWSRATETACPSSFSMG